MFPGEKFTERNESFLVFQGSRKVTGDKFIIYTEDNINRCIRGGCNCAIQTGAESGVDELVTADEYPEIVLS